MNPWVGKSWLILSWAALVAGCGTELEPVSLDLSGARASADVSDLAAVLAEAVTSDGRIQPGASRRLDCRLDSQLQKMALAGPTATPNLYPTDSARWAYWYNARAAWSAKLTALAGFPERVRPSAMVRRPFPLDGRTMSLEQIDAALLAESRRVGDFRLAACAPGVRADYAPLPNTPYSGADFRTRLAETLDALVLDQRRFLLNVQKRQVEVPSMLWACRDMVTAQYAREFGPCGASLVTALRPHLSLAARRRLDVALGYNVVPRERQGELTIPKRRTFYPGKIGRIEP
jgi:hypothetical protein